MSHRQLILQSLFTILTTSAPVPSPPSPRDPLGWQPQPRGRGTFQIILSCALTLGLCVWTAIHPDVRSGKTSYERVRHKLWLAVLALFVPEIVVSLAWGEWRETRTLYRAMVYEGWRKKVIARGTGDGEKGVTGLLGLVVRPLEPVKHTWWTRVKDVLVGWWKPVKDVWESVLVETGFGMDVDAFPKQVAFFVVMGGYVYVTKGKDGETIQVTADAFFHAFKNGQIDSAERIAERKRKGEDTKLITEINIRDIQDKGKASVLAKVIICGQVGWMVLQLIGRQIAGLTMTLIELHTLIHILIAAITYWFWWQKPLDVCEPIPINMEIPKEVKPGWGERPEHFQSKGGFRKFFEHLWLLPLPDFETIELPDPEPTPDAHDSSQEGTDSAQAAQTHQVQSPKETNGGPSESSGPIEVQVVAITTAAPDRIENIDNLGQPPDTKTSNQTTNPPKKQFGFSGPRPKPVKKSEDAPSGDEGKAPTKTPKKSSGFASRIRAKRVKKREDSLTRDEGKAPKKSSGFSSPLRSKPGRKSEDALIGDEEKGHTRDEGKQTATVNEHEEDQITEIIQQNLFACVFYVIYACLHAILWNTYFSTWAELWIWRGACLVVGIAPLIIFCLILLFKSIERLPHDETKLKDAKKYLDWIFLGIYLVASIGLLLECLVSLRRMPADVYASVPWTAYIPHF